MTCPICNSNLSPPVGELFSLPSVTSDCRPWSAGRSVQICEGCGVMRRFVHNLAEKDFAEVYSGYRASPEPEGRTKRILEFVSDKLPYRIKSGLDIGAGDGAGLRVISSHFPDANFQGYEPNSSNPKILRKRPEGKFDLITLFHVLEHVDNVHEMLAYIKSALTENGYALIQVPYTIMGPFDLVIADHIWHFNFQSLYELFFRCGFQIVYLNNEVIKKELTLLAKIPQEGFSVFKQPLFDDPIKWLLSYKLFLDTIDQRVFVYGTGPAAAWVGAILGDKVVDYLDDDISRQNQFNGKEVYGVSYQGQDRLGPVIPIVAPFPDYQLAEIKAKNPNLRFL